MHSYLFISLYKETKLWYALPGGGSGLVLPKTSATLSFLLSYPNWVVTETMAVVNSSFNRTIFRIFGTKTFLLISLGIKLQHKDHVKIKLYKTFCGDPAFSDI